MTCYAVSIFVGSFLLFLIQPILGRFILPWYGGSPAVWTTCMIFFQVVLVVGYLYAHAIGRTSPRWQASVHVALLVASLGLLPISPGDLWKPADTRSPVADILILLTATAGVPYGLLSASSPLLQRWLHLMKPEASPYRLFAVSNLGALLGLVAYPFAAEPLLPSAAQSRLWSMLYILYAAFVALCAVGLLRSAARPNAANGAGLSMVSLSPPTPLPEKLLWVGLSACGSVMLLATTNQMCQNVAVVPLLWILPLGLYLVSFIACFEYPRWYDRRIWIPLLLVCLLAVSLLLKLSKEADLLVQILILSATLLSSCMVCHGELARSKPPAGELTAFYLFVASGGALGGIFVGLVAPRLFAGYWEFPLALIATYVLAAVSVLREEEPLAGAWLGAGRLRSHGWAAGAWVLIILLGSYVYETRASTTAMSRSFFGVLRVYENDRGTTEWRRHLRHGRISHGGQFLDPARRREPTQYYGRETGVALAIEHHPRRGAGLRVGVVGLGTGTLATYGRTKDVLRFYEIDPEVAEVAKSYFHYLEDSPARVEIALGDGRVTLERELAEGGSQRFDVLALDAFSGDAIPVHLLTAEAFSLYKEHLRSDGILAVHISNLHLDFKPLVRGLARQIGLAAVLVENREDLKAGIFSSEWVVLTTNGEFLAVDAVASAITPWVADESGSLPPEVVWTDAHSNILTLLY